MGQTVRSRLAEMRERRELGSDWRAGRFPRDSAYALNVAYARRNWRALIVVGFVPTMMIPWALWATDGLLQGVVIGAALISGPWLALLAVISYRERRRCRARRRLRSGRSPPYGVPRGGGS